VRYIDIESLRELPEAAALISALERVEQEVAAENDPVARLKLINRRRKHWRRFRDLLEKSDVKRKCWYTESKNPGTDDDVDHYRPKGKIEERPDHPGYWWEAFRWRNYRLSCHISNRLKRSEEADAALGKGSHFPIHDEAMRWMNPASPCTESPTLLDPTDPSDPQLLTFLSNGRIDLHPAFDLDGTARARVESSRQLLHLDWEDFVEERSSLFARVTALVEEGDAADASDGPTAGETLKRVSIKLIRLTKPDRTYSAAAIAYIRMYRLHPWVKRFVMPHMPGEELL
jgi:uncharacterized protein (TIGR02646 family)